MKTNWIRVFCLSLREEALALASVQKKREGELIHQSVSRNEKTLLEGQGKFPSVTFKLGPQWVKIIFLKLSLEFTKVPKYTIWIPIYFCISLYLFVSICICLYLLYLFVTVCISLYCRCPKYEGCAQGLLEIRVETNKDCGSEPKQLNVFPPREIPGIEESRLNSIMKTFQSCFSRLRIKLPMLSSHQ